MNSDCIAVLIEREPAAGWQRDCIEHLRRSGRSVAIVGPGAGVPPAATALDLTATGDARAAAFETCWFFREPEGARLSRRSFAAAVAAGKIVAEVCLVERSGGGESIRRWGRFRLGANLWKTRERIVREVAAWPALPALSQPYDGAVSSNGVHNGVVSALAFSRGSARLAARALYERLFVERSWHSYLIDASRSGVVADPASLSESMKPLPHVGSQFFADPFFAGSERDGWVFGEAWDRIRNKGYIAAAPHPHRPGEPVVPVFERRSHLSYPFMFRADGELFCMPENSEEAQTVIYRCVQLPDRWEAFARILPGRRLCDATILRHDGRWWLFAGDTERGPNVNLFLFYAADLRGPWLPHPCNPVKTDITSARPAGAIFESDGALYRPSQDCARYYGAGVVINRIDTLNQDRYCETAVERLADVHTLNAVSERATLVDRVTPAFSLRKPYDRIVHRTQRGTRLEDAVPPNHSRRAALAFPVIWKDRDYVLPVPGATSPGSYYIKWDSGSGIFGEDWDRSPFDGHGVLLSLRGGFYHPIHIAQYALHQHAWWRQTNKRKHLQAFLAQARWFRDNQRTTERGVPGAYAFDFPWPRYHAAAGWISGMAQGEAISALLRAHAAAPDEGFDAAALRAAQPLRFPLERGGVTSSDRSGLFFEEVAAPPPAHILNGHLFALFGLWELGEFANVAWAQRLAAEACSTLARSLDAFDCGYWSYYSLAPGRGGGSHLATHKYHAFHIAQLRVLAQMSGDQTFARVADRWRNYVRDGGGRLRVTYETLGGLVRAAHAR